LWNLIVVLVYNILPQAEIKVSPRRRLVAPQQWYKHQQDLSSLPKEIAERMLHMAMLATNHDSDCSKVT